MPTTRATASGKGDDEGSLRRRTQTRDAQRAYRTRKQQSQLKLEEDVSVLQETVTAMHTTFLELYDDLLLEPVISNSQNSHLVRWINAIAARFNTLSTARELHLAQVKERGRSAGVWRTKHSRLADRRAEDKDSGTQPSRQGYRPSRHGKIAHSTKTGDQVSNFTDKLHVQQDDNVNPIRPSMTDPKPVNPYLERLVQRDVAYTYSFQESTFARRLQRVCLELAFRNLSNPGRDPAFIARTFGWSFTFTDRSNMTQRVQHLLRRGTNESLESWSLPSFSIGGAGTHFPRVDREGHPSYPPNLVMPTQALPPSTRDSVYAGKTAGEFTSDSFYAGEWYDAFEVDCYLRLMGIEIEPTSTFATIHTATRATDHNDAAGRNCQDSGGDTHDHHRSASNTWPFLLDVEKFLEIMLSGSSCFGRAPGFRKSDVGKALKGALQRLY
ncbi:hypothetical protein H2200_009561 [Cladophialophora chaetospira]|uniref:BZIP domain-containing protein n=1 Tax=Cladophialophora chaetospira TaxID=386627 RepID=A0AA38X2T1_9EURO|nr:hypothetical protein H2200_009561 [Cladophialophora chaetospira]